MPEQTVTTVEVSSSAYQLLEQLAASEQRAISAIIEDSLRMYGERVVAFRRMEEALKRAHELASENGTSEMSMDDINVEIATYRAEKRLREKMASCEL
jgi:predicted transcriptional regulator